MKICLPCFISILFFASCSPFKSLEGSGIKKEEIVATYSNDYDSPDCSRYEIPQLWQLLDDKKIRNCIGLAVKLSITKENRLKAQLLYPDGLLLDQKIIKGKFREDQGFYKRRDFKLVPILPILWWFNNEQIRFYYNGRYLVAEDKKDKGGCVVIMAGGSNECVTWVYKKME